MKPATLVELECALKYISTEAFRRESNFNTDELSGVLDILSHAQTLLKSRSELDHAARIEKVRCLMLGAAASLIEQIENMETAVNSITWDQIKLHRKIERRIEDAFTLPTYQFCQKHY